MLQRFFSYFWKSKSHIARDKSAAQLYQTIVHQARQPYLYQNAVPDTVDGRFDAIVLHMALVIGRLQMAGRPGLQLAQSLFDVFFRDMDVNLREIGVGDMSIAKHFRRMSRAFNGRVRQYIKALIEKNDDALKATLQNNLFRKSEATQEQIDTVMRYAYGQHNYLQTQNFENLLAGLVQFSEAGIISSK